MEKLSVIIATISDAIATNFTMAQAIHQLENDGIDYEIILVDNGSSEEDKLNLQSFLDFHKEFPIKYFEYPIKGTIPPHSFGVTQATGKYITLPDPHLIFSSHYFSIMLQTLKYLKRKNVELVFSPFSIGTIAKKDQEYVCSSHMVKPNPFGKVNNIGESCKYGAELKPVLSCTISSMVCEKEWFIKIGNMFPEAFEKAGGHTAESLLVGIPTWMFGKKCYVQPQAVVEHFIYRHHKGEGWNANMHLSMATAAYICGGQKYLDDMSHQYGKYVDGDLEAIPELAKNAREYMEKNAVISLDELVEKWEQIRYAS